MGGVQSSKRDSYPQTPLVEYRKGYIEEPLGFCSTFNDIPVCAALPAAVKYTPVNPPQKRQKHDPTNLIKHQPTQLSINEVNTTSQKILDVVTGQCASKSFPSFSELRDSMRRKKIVKRQDPSENLEMDALPNPECKLISEKTCFDLVAPTTPTEKVETTENCFNTPLNECDFNFSNENLFEYIDDDIGENLFPCEETSSQLSYCSDSSDTSDLRKKFSYEMRKDYYYL